MIFGAVKVAIQYTSRSFGKKIKKLEILISKQKQNKIKN